MRDMKTTDPQGTRALVASAPWLGCLVAALFWFNSSQTSLEYQMDHSAWPESPTTKRAQENLRSFLYRAPQRTLISAVAPIDPKRANSWTLYVDPVWKKQSPTEQRRLMRAWSDLYVQIATASPVDASTPQLLLRVAHGTPVAQ